MIGLANVNARAWIATSAGEAGMDGQLDKIRITARLAVAWLSNPSTVATTDSIARFLSSAHAALLRLEGAANDQGENVAASDYTRAVSVRQSLASRNHIISMIDGKPYVLLRRHLSAHGLTPAEYRERYRLKRDYPMVAPALSEQRRAVAKRIGLSRSRGKSAAVAVSKEPEPVVKPGRRKLSLSLST